MYLKERRLGLNISYVNLDFKVLKSVPWDKVDIEVMLVELHLAGKVFPGTRKDVHMFLDEKGYDYAGTVGKLEIFQTYKLLPML